MKPTNNPNINSKSYWNGIYGDEQKRQAYIENEVNPIPTMRFYRALDEVKEAPKFLDIGCGVGTMCDLVFMQRPGSEVWGTDISDNVIRVNSFKNPLINYKHQYIGEQNELPDNYFDCVFSGEVLEHLDEPKKLFEDAFRVLKPGGKFILTTPNGDKIKSEEHVWEFTHDDVEDLYRNNGFDRVQFIYLPKLEHLMVIMAVGTKKKG